ncbi:MAG: hypothetical protein RL033_1491 [Pseudomonadota bacterium]|jgi:hypothetical protein
MPATPDLTSPKPAEGAASPGESTPPAAAEKPRGAVAFIQDRFKGLVAEYGPLLFVVYFSIFGVVFVGSALAIQMGFQVNSAAGTAGVWGAAYVFTKVLQPLRIAATIALTPAVAAVLRRFRKTPPASSASADASDASESGSGRQS